MDSVSQLKSSGTAEVSFLLSNQQCYSTKG